MTKELVIAAILQATGVQPGTTEAVRAELTVPSIVEESDAFGFDPILVVAVIHTESHFDWKAVNPDTGALGLMQILRGGAIPAEMAHLKDEAFFVPRRNIVLGLAQLSHYRDRCRSMHGWLSRYDGHKGCRASEYSRKVIKLYRQLKKGAGG